ncbi:16S rRNA m(2)G-966 methyltransferase [Marinospirillum celere]|uniref:Ribosomal RNA small subunit methyltransferase D n=1 Tax=Marinospirillum celere TaxID=1122252 RepID=A0A1I1J449_9GAMM|nr:16S rRNA (guanine(966)-N(2))-methyltransferase RsmD [Marinospirillum celere]SFC40723.1 16S rRNA m(2)G-966 methyltransferase [Marinospirillum celere]
MPKRQKSLKQGLQGQVRIIGGDWSGRKLPVPEAEGLRPTSDRVKETLFNWLQFDLPASRCLDVFAGSGALAMESLSRGAARVLLLEKEPRVAKHLRESLMVLAESRAEVLNADSLAYLNQPASEQFDLVFLDPPFTQGLLEPACQLLQENGWLAPGAKIYLEIEKQAPALQVPNGWQQLKQKEAGEVRFSLYQGYADK